MTRKMDEYIHELKEKNVQIPRELKDIHLITATPVPLEHLADVSRKLKETAYMIDSYLFGLGIKQKEDKVVKML